MADIEVTDDLGKSAPDVKIDLSHPSSLLKYAKSQLLHLAVAPDFVHRAPLPLSTAAPNPVSFKAGLKHNFQLGNSKPEIDLTPSFEAAVRANATPHSNLFEEDSFPVPAIVPDQTGYVSLRLKGSLDLGVSGSSGDLTFGVDANRAVSLEYWKAFPLGNGEPTLGEATGKTISGFVIPARIDDLRLLNMNDVSTASGRGSLKISAAFQVSVAPNPLASFDLPLDAGKIEVKTGVMTGVSASFRITGSWQLRARRTSFEAIELSFYRERGTTLTTDVSASAGVSVTAGDTDLLTSLLDAIGTDPNDDATKKLFREGGLSEDEIATLTDAVKDGLEHSLAASLDLALSQVTDHEAVFQYEIVLAQLSEDSSVAVSRALAGDLSGLTLLESAAEGAVLAPGVKLLSSVLTEVHKNRTILKLNLLGLVNFVSLSELMRKSVVVKDPGTGYLTIADSATGERINAEVEPLRRRAALRKALFESLMVTAAYRVGNAIGMTGLSGHNFHFAFTATTDTAIAADYLNWFVAINLLTEQEREEYLKRFQEGGPSTCLLRTEFDDNACESLFFESPGALWPRDHYLDIGRRVMRALIDRHSSDIDRFRYDLLDRHWAEAIGIGANDNLGPLMGLHPTDPKSRAITQYLIGDVYTIDWWATAMTTAGQAVREMRQFLAGADPTASAVSPEFARRRRQLQKTLAGVIGNSRTRFDEPWGFIALLWAAGSTGASGRLMANGIALQRQ